MKHLTANEIIDFVSMTNLDEKSLKNASLVTSHIVECKACLQKVRAFQTIFDELSVQNKIFESKQQSLSHNDSKNEGLFKEAEY